ncbi:MAG: class I SAM-dependent methyltransferase [Spirochaetia bacterium]|nr:class I SAM-dependent methyltransferase [Spirochaetia bacterium]
MRGLPYYEEPEYHEYLISPERRELFPRKDILSQINWKDVHNLLDFGMGNGYFLQYFYQFLPAGAHIWGAECQEILIDATLKRKVKEKIENFIPFYVERTEHPLLPDWIPEVDMIFASCVLSTFADPTLAIKGIARNMKKEGRIILLDWEKKESPSGPDIMHKISLDRMKYFVEDSGFLIKRKLKTNEYIYALELVRNPDIDPSELPRISVE